MLLQILQGTTHNCFPVVVYEETSKCRKRRLVGCVMRKHLLVLLSEKFKSKVLRKHSKIVEEECSSRKIQRKMSMKSMRGFRGQVDDERDSHINNNDGDEAYVPPELVTFEEFENLYPKFAKLEDIHLTEQEGEMCVVFFFVTLCLTHTHSLSHQHISHTRKQVLGSDLLHEHSTHSATLRFTYKSL